MGEDRRQPSISPPREPRWARDVDADVPPPNAAYAGNAGQQNQPGRGPMYVAPPAPYAPAAPSGAAQGDRLPAIRAPSPRPGGRRPGSGGLERRPRSGAGERRRPRSARGADEVPPGLQGEQNSSLIGVLQTEVQHLTQQVPILLTPRSTHSSSPCSPPPPPSSRPVAAPCWQLTRRHARCWGAG